MNDKHLPLHSANEYVWRRLKVVFGEAFFTKSRGDDAENIEKFITNVLLIT